jgi:transcription elongation GreA/GreB family factor
MMTFKQKIHAQYLQIVEDKIDVFRDMIANLASDAQNDAKSSAGDKHETALSMMHLEQEKLTQKLKENLDMKAVLEKIDSSVVSEKIALGSLVKANGIYLFVSGALPKINVDGITVIALSPQSPLGSKLIGNAAGFSFEIQSTTYNIESVF